MEKVWFVFNQDHHTGPFSSEEMFRMFYDDVIGQQSLVWKEGLGGWEPLSQVRELYSIIDSSETPVESDDFIPIYELDEKIDKLDETLLEEKFLASEVSNVTPPLQPLQITASETSIPIEKIELPHTVDKLGEPAVVPENIIIPLPQTSLSTTFPDESFQDESLIESKLENALLAPNKYVRRKQIIAAFAIIVLVVVTWWIVPSGQKIREFQGLTVDDHMRLKETITMKKGFQVNLALQDEQKSLWMTANQDGNYLIHLTLQSIKNKILSEEEAVFFSKAVLNNHIARFEQLEIIKGKKFIPGYYDAEIYVHELGLMPTLKQFLKQIPYFETYFSDYERSFKIKKTVLLQGWSPSKFSKLLEDYITQRDSNKQRPLLELRESYSTLLGLMDQIAIIFNKVITSSTKSKTFLDDFNRAYANNISPVFQGIMNENKKIHDDISDISQPRKNMYNEFLTIGKEMGGIVADIVVKTQKFNNLTTSTKATLIEDLREKLGRQRIIVNRHIAYLDKQTGKAE